MDLIEGATTCSGGAKVKGGIGSSEPHGFPGNLWEAHPLREEAVWMDRVNKVHSIQTRQEFLWKLANQVRPEEALG